MEIKNIILIAIIILIIAVVGIFVFSGQQSNDFKNVTDGLSNITNKTVSVDNKTNVTNNTDDSNSTVKNTTDKNKTYKVYNPQSDSYVTVIGEKYDDDVNRWYTYDTDGVRYYNTRIN